MSERMRSVKEILSWHFEQRRSRSDKYSMRAFASELGISSGRLTEIMNGLNIPSPRTLEKIARNLKLTFEESENLLRAAEHDKNQRAVNQADVVIKKEDLHIAVDWQPYAIVALLMTYQFELTPEAVADRLGLSLESAEKYIEKLKELRLIVEGDEGWRPSAKKVATETDIPREIIRKSHEEKMELAISKMHEVDVEMRDYSSITFPADPKNLMTVKKMITDFRRDLAEKMALGCPTEVYVLNLQLFPVTKVNGFN